MLREIPLKCTESKIEAELGRVSSLEVLRVHIAESGMYAYVQMRSADDAERLMLTFNKIPLLIDGCTSMAAVFEFFLRFLNFRFFKIYILVWKLSDLL